MHPSLIPWALAGGTAVTVGFARFGYALILPAMQSSLKLNYTQAGWLNTSNALGYLLGAVLTVILVKRLGNHRLFVAGLIVTTMALLLNGLTEHFLWLNIIRFITGMASAWAFICGGVLASVISTRAIAIYFGGGGTGMLISGAILPWWFEWAGADSWQWAWIGMGLACVILSTLAIAAARYSVTSHAPESDQNISWLPCARAFIAYFLFGAGYIAYMTFMVAWVHQYASANFSLAWITSVMWSLLGVASLFAPRLWSGVFHERRNGLPIAATMAALGVGAILPLLFTGVYMAWLSAFMVGASVFMVPSAITGFVKSNLPAAGWGSALAVATTLFALGQTLGPVAAGWVSDLSGSLSVGLGCSALILFVGAVLALFQPPLHN
ncbi:MAG TPA: YbfB/YjiJ family MFS transporter [Paenalcaligenes sp.]|nr:YbfB/YjiJ family MFS transporter [Paenalcaligenes sp.]